MATPTTLLELATQKRDAAKTQLSDAQQRLAKAQQAIAKAKATLATAATERAALETEAAAIRQILPAHLTEADGEAQVAAVALLDVRGRARLAAGLHAAQALAAAQADANQAQADLNAATGGLASAEAKLKATAQAHRQRTQWKTTLGAAPLTTIKADAASALTQAPFKTADTRLKADRKSVV